MSDWDEVSAWLESRSEAAIETSCAQVFLTGGSAFKIKRPVDLGFLDFSTVAKRKLALKRELDLNRRFSGNIYRAVHKVTRKGEVLMLDGEGVAVEWLLEMRRFDPSAVIGERPEAVDPALAEQVGRLIGRLHGAGPVSTEPGLDAYLYTVDSNVEALARVSPPLDRTQVDRIIEATRAGRAAVTPLLEERRQAGFRRLCHGDLHLGNILLEDGHPVPFDCLEFSDVLGRMDVAYDAAFPIMDLAVRGRPVAANVLLNAWLDEAARGFPESLWDGLAALPQFLAVRACVRAHVTAATGKTDAARRYLAAAEMFLAPPTPRLMAIGGYSGAGKSVEAARRAALSQPGDVILRSDLVRKRLWGVGPLDPLPEAAYRPDMDARTFGEMFAIAGRTLAAGWPVILDATFLDPEIRRAAETVAIKANVPFEGLWLDATPNVLRTRVAARRDDASDADVAILERQLARGAGTVTWARQSLKSP